jgi:hypothetical protein
MCTAKWIVAAGCTLIACSQTIAQPPGGAGKAPTGGTLVERMMAFDKNGDGKLTKDEITDARLLRLFERADANKDGVVTREELTQLESRENASRPEGRGFGPPGGFGGGGPGGRGGPGGPGGPPPMGQILPSFVQEELQLSAAQKKLVAKLQKEVDSKLEKILSDEQKQQWKTMRLRGPGGPGGFGPRGGGPGRPGGEPGEDRGPPPRTEDR